MAQFEPTDTNLCQMFRKLDVDASGTVSSSEFLASLSGGIWIPPNPETVRVLFDFFGHGESGTVDFKEFCALVWYFSDRQNCFSKSDLSGNGTIDKDQFNTILNSLGYRVSDDVHALLTTRFDSINRGTLIFDDFIQACVFIETLPDRAQQND